METLCKQYGSSIAILFSYCLDTVSILFGRDELEMFTRQGGLNDGFLFWGCLAGMNQGRALRIINGSTRHDDMVWKCAWRFRDGSFSK